ncbi:MAG: TonB family protein [Aeromonadaceae bacterium]
MTAPRIHQICLLLSLLLHAGLWLLCLSTPPQAVPAVAEPSPVIRFGLVAAHAGEPSPAQVAPVITPPPPRPAEVKPSQIQAPAKSRPVVKPVSKPAARRTVPEPEPIRPERQRAPAPVNPPSVMANKAGDRGALGSRRSDNKQRESGLQQQAGGAPDGAAFDLLVRRHLLSRKQTPRLLGGRRSGAVVVEFVIDRQGRLLRQLMGKTSGVREFDHAARTLVHNAAPYPSAPADLPWQERRYRIEIQYQSR